LIASQHYLIADKSATYEHHPLLRLTMATTATATPKMRGKVKYLIEEAKEACHRPLFEEISNGLTQIRDGISTKRTKYNKSRKWETVRLSVDHLVVCCWQTIRASQRTTHRLTYTSLYALRFSLMLPLCWPS
jgi:hypothetical protein